MKDLKLTDNNRISFKNGDFETVEGENRIKQHIKTGIKILLGDWILDYRKGVDIIGGLRAYPDILKAQIKSAINEVFGVDRVLKFSFDDSEEVYKVKATVLSGSQTFDVEGETGAI
nr:MAG TPA: Protein of unknown function (DUF2634) [Caudoviricetes sp.]